MGANEHLDGPYTTARSTRLFLKTPFRQLESAYPIKNLPDE